ncbi:hypothetical protein DAI21_22710 (plasmid) [Lelliottia sp. WB101]|jgi:ribosomal protein L37AE/L43A|nr:hypothetical protein DAI21_22710 [Lelliottia sp. WB101]
MAWYASSKKVKLSSNQAKYKEVKNISEEPLYPGIYKCDSCGFEDVINRNCSKFPPCSNCAKPGHSNTWKLLVRAEDK